MSKFATLLYIVEAMNDKVLIIGNHPINADLIRQYSQRGDEVVSLMSSQAFGKTDIAAYKEFALLADWDTNSFEADNKVMNILQQIAANAPDPINGKRPLCHLLLRSHSLLHMIRLGGFRKEIEDKLEVNAGMLIENIVAQMLVAAGHKLYFYSNADKEDAESRMEIDFLIRKEPVTSRHNIIPIEAKSSTGYTITSLQKCVRKFGEFITMPTVIHTSDSRMDENQIRYIPVYFTPFL